MLQVLTRSGVDLREVLELREGRNWTYQQITTCSGVEASTIEALLS
jgi:DNA-directed RNA polymerase specialized sigma24 family protein